MSSLMYAQMGNKVLGAISGYSQGAHQSKLEGISRQYRETMTGISMGMQLGAQTVNEANTRDAFVRAGMTLQLQSLKDTASATAGAAAAGVKGGSVTNTLRGLARSRMMASQALSKRKEQQGYADMATRRNLAFSRASGRNISPISQPSAASALLGLGATLIETYDSHQPEGSKISDTLSRVGTS